MELRELVRKYGYSETDTYEIIFNRKFIAETNDVFCREGKLHKLKDFMKYQGIQGFGLNYIVFGNPQYDKNYNLDAILESILNLPEDYPDDFFKFLKENNMKNPFRIEVTFERENSKPGTLSCIFGHWAIAPYWEGDCEFEKQIRSFDNDSPQYAQVVFRPEKMEINRQIIHDLKTDVLFHKPTGYQISHVRIANDLIRQLEAIDINFSKYEDNNFIYTEDHIDEYVSKKWKFLIPCLQYLKLFKPYKPTIEEIEADIELGKTLEES